MPDCQPWVRAPRAFAGSRRGRRLRAWACWLATEAALRCFGRGRRQRANLNSVYAIQGQHTWVALGVNEVTEHPANFAPIRVTRFIDTHKHPVARFGNAKDSTARPLPTGQQHRLARRAGGQVPAHRHTHKRRGLSCRNLGNGQRCLGGRVGSGVAVSVGVEVAVDVAVDVGVRPGSGRKGCSWFARCRGLANWQRRGRRRARGNQCQRPAGVLVASAVGV